ncbi:MAG: hypothetical protein V1717_00935 [Candidatus Micrarchaeota archaeon]
MGEISPFAKRGSREDRMFRRDKMFFVKWVKPALTEVGLTDHRARKRVLQTAMEAVSKTVDEMGKEIEERKQSPIRLSKGEKARLAGWIALQTSKTRQNFEPSTKTREKRVRTFVAASDYFLTPESIEYAARHAVDLHLGWQTVPALLMIARVHNAAHRIYETPEVLQTFESHLEKLKPDKPPAALPVRETKLKKVFRLAWEHRADMLEGQLPLEAFEDFFARDSERSWSMRLVGGYGAVPDAIAAGELFAKRAIAERKKKKEQTAL